MKNVDRRISARTMPKSHPQLEWGCNGYKGPSILLNLSSHGAYLEISEKLPIRALILIKFPKHQTPIPAKIIWRKPFKHSKNFTANGKMSWGYGVLFYQPQKEIISSIINDYLTSQNINRDRRNLSRRTTHSSHGNNDSRLYERRGAKEFIIKANRLSTSFDKWTTYHTYLRAMDYIQHPYASIGGQKKIMLGSNSYLGLSTHPLVKEAAIKAIEKYGVGSGGVPVLSGTTELHDELCETIARFKGAEASIVFSSGFIANNACLSTLFNSDDYVLLNDERNHASIIDGCRMTKAIVRFFRHNDSEDLEKKIQQYPLEQTKIIIVDGVYSMDGDLCDLPSIFGLAQRYNCLMMVDDAHSTGVIGAKGRGTAEHFGLTGKIDLTTVTLSKSIGCIGGAICGSRSLIKSLIHLSRPFIFSTSLPPAICAASIQAIKIIEEQPGIVQRLRENTNLLIDGLTELGLKVCKTDSAIIPVIIGDETLTYKFVHMLGEEGIFVNAVSRPAVPRDLSRLRISGNAELSHEDIEKVIKVFKIIGRKLKIIP